MRIARATLMVLLGGFVAAARGAEDFLDQAAEVLTVSSPASGFSARLSGTLDLEEYWVSDPAPGLIYTDESSLFSPRLTLFLDAQLGPRVYFFAQARVDRGFDPGEENLEARLDEWAFRFSLWSNPRLSLQAGKFGTVVGNWVPRHGSWDNPFVTAPLPYENLTGIWDSAAARTSGVLLAWAHVVPTHTGEYEDKHKRLPVIWGPSYASGAALLGEVGRLNYAAEVKNAALSSRPDSWTPDEGSWEYPTVSGRIGYRPNMMWNLGLSASSGVYLLPSAARTVAPGYGLGDYRENVLAQDVCFAWHYWQVWVEAYEARFAVPRVGDADTFSYYAEVKYKFTPQFFGAVRWNQQTFGTIEHGAGNWVKWGRDAWRIDVAPSYRFTPHLQGKLQYSLLHEDGASSEYSHTLALQLTARF